MTTKPVVWDLRLEAQGTGLSLLVEAMSKDEAQAIAIQDCEQAGWHQVRVLWCIEYPPKQVRKRTRAITDD